MSESDKDKELWRGRGIGIASYEHGFSVYDIVITPEKDKNGKPNTGAGKEIKKRETYHSKLHHALMQASNRVAKREAKTIAGYIDVFTKVAAELLKATGGQ